MPKVSLRKKSTTATNSLNERIRRANRLRELPHVGITFDQEKNEWRIVIHNAKKATFWYRHNGSMRAFLLEDSSEMHITSRLK